MRRRGLRALERRTVIVHTPPPGPSLRGVLVNAYKDCLVLIHARHLDNSADLAGEVIVPITPGVFVQALEQDRP